jgi:hypothetical protein
MARGNVIDFLLANPGWDRLELVSGVPRVTTTSQLTVDTQMTDVCRGLAYLHSLGIESRVFTAVCLIHLALPPIC